jgi:CubicO group peptidase (beta-lactamase class C family)
MNRLQSLAFTALLVCITASFARADGFEWKTDTPESQGMSSEKLKKLADDLGKSGSHTFLVVRHDKIVFEWYSKDWSADKPHGTASLAKAMVGGMSLAVAMQDGRVKSSDFVAKYIPAWKDDPQKSKITFGQLATHTSGMDDAEEDDVPHETLPGWKGAFWKREPDPFTISRDQVPMIANPGQRVRYSNPGMAMLSFAVTAAIQPGEQKDIRSLLNKRIFEPIGIGPREWTIGYGKAYRVDGLDLYGNWGGASFTARASARIGRLMLHNGQWEGKQILSPEIVQQCVEAPESMQSGEFLGPRSPRPGYGWWNNRDMAWNSMPRDMYLGSGANHQSLIVIPSLDMVVVRNGADFGKTESYWVRVETHFFKPLMDAVIDPPYHASAVIKSVDFDPPSAIIRKAPDSDNWPMTWGDDDQIYTSYGDGSGFEPFVEHKLSMGIARVEGTPPDFKGINLRASTIERTGGGAKGAKASGILMADGVLYMWVRNTHNSTLTWSTDHGANWTWGFTFDTSFGCPTFLNFGRNYAGAPDDFVYTYSQDGPTAYEPYDGIVMARVNKQHLREKDAYEYFAGVDASGNAKWSHDIAQRGMVFNYPGHCERLDAAYCPALKRYLLTVSFGQGKGWGLFDAPSPVGPWTTAFITHDWGLGDTHGYRLSTKWMSPDGKSMWLVFSGRDHDGLIFDAFCARKMSLTLYPPDK